jgi:hypothetical protein
LYTPPTELKLLEDIKTTYVTYVIEAFTDLEILLEILFPVEILLVHGFLE